MRRTDTEGKSGSGYLGDGDVKSEEAGEVIAGVRDGLCK
jgi:hypothetical protein